jgi:hypothetical protein
VALLVKHSKVASDISTYFDRADKSRHLFMQVNRQGKLDQIRTDFEVIVRKSARNRGTDYSWRGKTALELACSIGKV